MNSSVLKYSAAAGAELAAFRGRFPLLARRVYVNSCSQGALSTDVTDAMAAFHESWASEGSPWERWVGEVEALRAAFAASIGADADEVAIMPSASVGISAIASALTWRPRDTVVLGRFEFPTMGHVWLAQESRGARVRWVEADGERIEPEAYAAAVREDTRIVPLTHVCYRNGFRLDVAAIARLCRERGAYTLLDDYQQTGTTRLDVRALGVDMLVSGALKYLLGPSGIAFLYVRRALIESLTPTMTGWFGRVDPYAFAVDRLDWNPTARRFETGTPPVPNAYAARAGLALLQSIPAEQVEAHITHLASRCIDGATAAGYRVLTPADPARRGPLVVVASTDAQTLAKRLLVHGVIGSARGEGLRLSFHAYNTEADVDAALAALERESTLIQGTRRI